MVEFAAKELLPASEALRVLTNASEEAALALGTTRAMLRNMILTVLPVPPLACAPRSASTALRRGTTT